MGFPTAKRRGNKNSKAGDVAPEKVEVRGGAEKLEDGVKHRCVSSLVQQT